MGILRAGDLCRTGYVKTPSTGPPPYSGHHWRWTTKQCFTRSGLRVWVGRGRMKAWRIPLWLYDHLDSEIHPMEAQAPKGTFGWPCRRRHIVFLGRNLWSEICRLD